VSPERESRRFTRRPLEVEIQVGDTSMGAELRFDSHDFSAGGVFLRSDLLLEVGEVLWISFILPAASIAIRTRGRVVRVHKDASADRADQVAGMGIEFLDLGEIERAALSEYLESPDPA
jgi:c-di-GMP-binding flagellar brake protein YcgR